MKEAWVCHEYQTDLTFCLGKLLVLTVEAEMEGRFEVGRKIHIEGVDYILTERKMFGKALVHYRLEQVQ